MSRDGSKQITTAGCLAMLAHAGSRAFPSVTRSPLLFRPEKRDLESDLECLET
jgi:hypothetical protein